MRTNKNRAGKKNWLREEVESRQRVEAALRVSEKQIKQLIDDSPIAILVSSGTEEHVESLNDKFIELFGYTSEDMPDAAHWWPLAYPDEKYRDEIKTQWLAKIEQANRKKGQIEPMEAVVRCKDGSRRYVEFRYFSIGQEHLVTFVDLTERKQAEDALRERERHSQSLLHLSRNLERAQTYAEVLNAARDEVKAVIGYQSLWAYLLTEDKKYFKALIAGGPLKKVVMENEETATLTIEGDQMLEEIAKAKEIIIVEDAQTDERTDKEIVARLGNHTIVNIPIILFDRHLGSIGTGTFGDEGVRVPSNSEQKYLIALASHMAVALDRIHLLIERHQAEESLRRLNRELRAISNCNQILLRAMDEQTLLNDICHIICDEAGYHMAWVGYAENNEAKSVHPVAWAGNEAGYLEQLKLTWADTERGHDPTDIAIRSGESTSIQDFTTVPQALPWRENALQRGYRSNIALPLKDENANTFGALTIYSTEPMAFTPDEIRLLEELAGNLAFGIVILRARTEHKRVEEQLRSLVDLQSAILNNAAYMVISTDSKGVIMTFNPAAERALGYTAEECIGKLTPVAFHDPDELAERARVFSAELGETIEPGFEVFAAKARRNLPNEFEWMYIRKDGSHFPVLLSVTALYDPQGNIVGFLGIVSDITERKRAEEALRTTKLLLEQTLMQSPVPMALVSMPDAMIRYANPACLHFLGIDDESSIIDTPLTEIKPSWQDFDLQGRAGKLEDLPLVRSLMGFKTEGEERCIIRKDGSTRYGLVSGAPIFDDSGQIIAGYLVMMDITERKQAEMTFSRERELLRTLIDNMLEEVYVKDRERRFLLVNGLVVQALGAQSMDEIIGKRDEDFMPPDVAKQFADEENEIMRTGKPLINDENTPPYKPGPNRWYVRTKLPLRDGAGNIIGLAGLGSDITERKQTEEVLKKRKEELERFERLTIGRELKMVELKNRIVELEAKLLGKE